MHSWSEKGEKVKALKTKTQREQTDYKTPSKTSDIIDVHQHIRQTIDPLKTKKKGGSKKPPLNIKKNLVNKKK